MRVPIPIRGIWAVPFKLAGVQISRMNPNLCNLCETKFTSVKKSSQVTVAATILFADIRGYTSLTEASESERVTSLLGDFYEHCSFAIWEHDGIVNKLIGDAVFAIFNFPIRRPDHVEQAVLGALDLQRRCQSLQATLSGGAAQAVGVGVGIHTGDVAIGEIGHRLKDFTAIGDVVNLAARLQGAAQPGEVLVTESVYAAVRRTYPSADRDTYALKGISQPVAAYRLRA
jgi:class 3 adenylate cyclase